MKKRGMAGIAITKTFRLNLIEIVNIKKRDETNYENGKGLVN